MRGQTAAAWAIGLAIGAVAAQGIVFRDRARNLTISGLTSWRITRIDDALSRMQGQGRPLVAVWNSEEMTLRAAKVDGKLRQAKGGRLQLEQADASGGVGLSLASRRDGQPTRTTNLESDSLQYSASNDQAVLPGSLTIVSTVEGGRGNFRIAGSRATLTLAPLGEKAEMPLRAGEIAGPVTLRLETLREPTAEEKAEGRKAPVPVVVTGVGDRLVFNDQARTLTLSGNVAIDGNDGSAFGKVEAQRAVLTLNERREIVDLELSGEPGRATVSDRRKSNLK